METSLVYLLVYLLPSVLGDYGFQEFFFRENWLGNSLFAIFDPTWTHILAPKGINMEFIKQNFNFQSLRKTEAISLPSMWLTNLSNNL